MKKKDAKPKNIELLITKVKATEGEIKFDETYEVSRLFSHYIIGKINEIPHFSEKFGNKSPKENNASYYIGRIKKGKITDLAVIKASSADDSNTTVTPPNIFSSNGTLLYFSINNESLVYTELFERFDVTTPTGMHDMSKKLKDDNSTIPDPHVTDLTKLIDNFIYTDDIRDADKRATIEAKKMEYLKQKKAKTLANASALNAKKNSR